MHLGGKEKDEVGGRKLNFGCLGSVPCTHFLWAQRPMFKDGSPFPSKAPTPGLPLQLKQRHLQRTFAVHGGGDKTSGEGASASPLPAEENQGGYLRLDSRMVKEKALPAKPFHTAALSRKISYEQVSVSPSPCSPLCIVWHWDEHTEILPQGKAK